MAKAKKATPKLDAQVKLREEEAAKAEDTTPTSGGGYAAAREELRQRLAELAAREEESLARQFAKEAFNNLAEHIKQGKDGVLKDLWDDYTESLKHFSGGSATTTSGGSGERKPRRSADEMKAAATRILEIIKDESEGISAKDLSTKMKNEGLEASGVLKDFLKKHAGHTVKTKGDRAAMVYHY